MHKGMTVPALSPAQWWFVGLGIIVIASAIIIGKALAALGNDIFNALIASENDD